MADKNPPNDPDAPLSVADMRGWLAQEIRDISKATELRMQEASAIVTAYAAGEISSEEAGERSWKYTQRWGDALPGVRSSEKMTNAQILAMVDESTQPDFVKRLMREPAAGRGTKKSFPG